MVERFSLGHWLVLFVAVIQSCITVSSSTTTTCQALGNVAYPADSHCYGVTTAGAVPGQYVMKRCPLGTIYKADTCMCGFGSSVDRDHDCLLDNGKVFSQSGGSFSSVHISGGSNPIDFNLGSGIQSTVVVTNSGGSSNIAISSFINTSTHIGSTNGPDCMNKNSDAHQYFHNLINQQGAACDNIINAVKNLHQVTEEDGSMDCANQYTSTLSGFIVGEIQCKTCFGTHYVPAYVYNIPFCIATDPHVQDLHKRLYHHNHKENMCSSHDYLWQDLNGIQNNLCKKSLLDTMYREIVSPDFTESCSSCENSVTNRTVVHGFIMPHVNSEDLHCFHIALVEDMIQKMKENPCLSRNKVWTGLKNLLHQDVHCFQIVVKAFANVYSQFTSSPSYCSCQNKDIEHHTNTLCFHHALPDYVSHCKTYDRNYNSLYQDTIGSHYLCRYVDSNHMSSCGSHHDLWKRLSHITATYYHNGHTGHCQNHLVDVLAGVMNAASGKDPCLCTDSTPPPSYKNCSEFSTFASVAHSTNIFDPSVMCAQGNASSSAAAITQLCSAPSSFNTWKRGLKVIENCNTIPRFSPVASFKDNFVSNDVVAGVLIDCDASSLTVVTQTCENPIPAVYVISESSPSSILQNPALFYSVSWV